MIELAAVVEPDAVVAALAAAFAVNVQPGSTLLESIVDWCRRRRLLLIVDNCEHVIDAVSEALAAIVTNCPTVAVIATSREPLGLDGEWVHRVAPLDRPAAVELFTQRAFAADSGFVFDDADQQTVGTLCERLDGIPLAIELAAARVRSMSPTELLERLEDRFRLLRGTARGRNDRHQTLRAAVAWSYQLLTDAERVVFERASVFAGSFDLAAAEAVCSDEMIDHADVMDFLAGLVDKSIVVAERHASGMRYRLLETLREFGEEQLVARADGDGPHDRHLRHYVELAEHTDRVFRGPRELEAGEVFDVEWDNLRAAHAWSIITQDLDQAERLLAATWQYASSRARHETADWIERTLTIQTEHRQPKPHTYGLAAWWANTAHLDESQHRWAQRGIDSALNPAHPSTALCWCLLKYDDSEQRRLRPFDPVNRLEAATVGLDLDHDWWALVMLAEFTPPPRQQDQLGQKAEEHKRGIVARLIETADRVGSPSLKATAALVRGNELIDGVPADAEHALEWYHRALRIAREARNVILEGECVRAVALATTDLAADERAAEVCRSALAHLHETANWHELWKTMDSAALVLATLGHLEQASIALGRLDPSPKPFWREISFGFRQRALELVHRDDRAEHWITLGATMDRDHVVTQTIEHLAAAAGALPT